jgi:prepilin-type N-terminal cleavage/methylation domain-containing protein
MEQKSKKQNSTFRTRGFTLLEILLTLAILVILSVAGVGGYRTYGKNVEVTSLTQSISSELRLMQAKSMAGESGLKWGIHFVNSTNDYYELFSTPTTYASASTTINATTTFPRSVSFSDPTSGQSKDIIFDKITGVTTATSVTVISEDITKTIQVSAFGIIE